MACIKRRAHNSELETEAVNLGLECDSPVAHSDPKGDNALGPPIRLKNVTYSSYTPTGSACCPFTAVFSCLTRPSFKEDDQGRDSALSANE